MRTLLSTLAACLFLPAQELVTDYGRERTLRVTSELELDLETTAMEMTIDDEPVEHPSSGGSSSRLARRSVLVDKVLQGAPGEPRRIQRTFETLHDALSFTFGGEERGDEREYPLQGVALELTLDEEGKVQSELVSGPEPEDEALLEDHDLALALDAFLPAGPVEPEASWELDAAAVKRALATVIDAELFAEPPPEERGRGGRGGGRAGPGRLLALLEWEAEATLIELEGERDGVPCVRIALELEGKGTLPEPSSRGPGGRGFVWGAERALPALEGTVEARLEGELWFSIGEGRPLALELEGELSTDNRIESERDGSRFSMHSQQSGPLTLTVQVETE